MKFYHMLRSGMSWKLNETIIELWHSLYDAKTPTSRSYSEILDNEEEAEDDVDNEGILNLDANQNESFLIDSRDNCCRKRISQIIDDNEEGNDDDEDEDCGADSISDNEYELNDNEGQWCKQIGSGLKECDSLLVTCEDKSVAVVWQK